MAPKQAADGERSEGPDRGRRNYLKFGAAALGGAVAGPVLSGTAAAATRHGIQFDETLDAVDDLGLDPNGNEPIDLPYAWDGRSVLIEFPEGEYRISDMQVIKRASQIGFLGVGDVRFRPDDGSNLFLLNVNETDEMLFENIDIDIRADHTTAGFRFVPDEKMYVGDVEFLGRGVRLGDDEQNAFQVAIQDEDGEGTIERVVHRHGSAMSKYRRGRHGIACGSRHEGTITIKDCVLCEFGNNGIYMSRCPGDVRVEGGFFQNNNVSAVRLSGKGSSVDGATIEVDLDKYDGPLPNSGGFNTRGVVVEDDGSTNKPPGVEVTNCDIHLKRVPGSGGGIFCWSDDYKVIVKNTRIRVDDVESGGAPAAVCVNGSEAILDGVSVTGEMEDSFAIDELGSDSVVRDCCINQPGAERGGIRFDRGADDCTISNTTIDVTDKEIVENGADVNVSGISEGGSCPVPSIGSGSSSSPAGGSDDSNEEQSDSNEEEEESEPASAGGPFPYETDGEEEIRIRSVDGEYAEYDFDVDGSVETTDSVESHDDPDDDGASGYVVSKDDDYDVDGTITSFSAEKGTIEVFADGDPIATVDDDGAVAGGSSGGSDGGSSDGLFPYETDGEERLTIGSLDGEYVEFDFDVDGSVEATDTTDSHDDVDDDGASGFVVSKDDAFDVDGTITSFDVSNGSGVEVSIGGQSAEIR